MPRRSTKRGAERTALSGDYDAIVCGASFAGPRDGARAGRRRAVLLLDRYDVGERQTSACAAPTDWLEVLGLEGSIRQTFDRLVLHTPARTVRFPLPWTFSTFDYRTLCELLDEQNDAEFETAKVEGRAAGGPRRSVGVSTDRGEVDRAAGGRRPRAGAACSARTATSPPTRRSRAGSRCTRADPSGELEIWIDRSIVPAGYGWSFPADDEVRVGVGSFDPRFHVKEPTVDLAERLQPRRRPLPGQLDPAQAARRAVDGDVFFAGDSAGHCLPLTAEGIRTAFYFGIALGRELRAGDRGRATARRRRCAATPRSPREHEWKFRWMLRAQRFVPRVPPRALALATRAMATRALHALVLRPLPGDRATRTSRGAPGTPVRAAAALAPDRTDAASSVCALPGWAPSVRTTNDGRLR